MPSSEERQVFRQARQEIADAISAAAANEAQRYHTARTARVATTVAREHLFLETFEGVVRKYLVGRYSPPAHRPKKTKKIERVLQALWSDHHYGSDLDPKEVPHRYGAQEETRRLGKLVTELVEYKPRYRGETKLHLHVLGDMIQGQLHDPRDGAPLALQLMRMIHNLSQAISYAAGHFTEIDVFFTPGNHGRNMARHPDRAVHQKWDSNEQAAYFAVSQILAKHPNVRCHLFKTPYYISKTFGHTSFFTHGDTVLKPGYPGSTISVKNLRQQVNQWNVGAAKPHTLFAVGHVHIGSVIHLPEGPTFITNGCLVPTDPFALSIGAPNSNCGQWMWETVPDHPVGDIRFVTVGPDTDRDATFDRIVRPFEGS